MVFLISVYTLLITMSHCIIYKLYLYKMSNFLQLQYPIFKHVLNNNLDTHNIIRYHGVVHSISNQPTFSTILGYIIIK